MPAPQFRDLTDRFAQVADRLSADDWDAPSPCADWRAADVVAHLIQTQRDFLAPHGHDLAAPTGADPAARWHAHAGAVTSLLEQPGVAGQAFDGYFGPTTVGATLTTFYGFDLVVHRWDLAQAAGIDTSFSDDELDLVATSIEGFGQHMYTEGICGPPVQVAADAPRQHQLLALTGRDPANPIPLA